MGSFQRMARASLKVFITGLKDLVGGED
jgi:hypothetical protein